MKDVQEIAFDALREMYSEAEPPLDFDHALENPDEYGENWYVEHYLDSDRQSEIVEKHCERHDLSGDEHTAVTMTAILNYGPRGIKE